MDIYFVLSDMKIGQQMWYLLKIRMWLMTTNLGHIRDTLLAHKSHGLKVSLCDHLMSVVVLQ